MPGYPDHQLTVLIDGKRHPISDCEHWRIGSPPACANGFDLELNPCSKCDVYAKRADDPFRGARAVAPRTVAAKTVQIKVPSPETADQPNVPVKRNLVGQAISWLKAEASALVSSLPDAAYEARIACCKACPELHPIDAPKVGYCKACGCGMKPRAELTIKGRMPAATCPLKKWAR